MWSSSFLASLQAFWLLLWLGGVCISLTAQSTTSGPPQPDTKTRSAAVSADDLLTLRNKVASLQTSSETLAELVAKLQRELADSETIQQTLSDSLTQSSTALESLTQASEARAKLDQKAIDQVRGQLWLWAGGGAAVGLATTLVVSLFHH